MDPFCGTPLLPADDGAPSVDGLPLQLPGGLEAEKQQSVSFARLNREAVEATLGIAFGVLQLVFGLVCKREGRFPAGLDVAEVHQDSGHAVAAVVVGLVMEEVVVVLVILLRRLILQNLDAFALVLVDEGPGGDLLLNAFDDFRLPSPEEHPAACANLVQMAAACLRVDDPGAGDPRLGKVDEVLTLLATEEAVVDKGTWLP
mmetsp:Transcript_35089/g.99515  ORF Transcript_35089/g.99515 Transcript_35089/m.99515 type:complete len:202 (+) Transcript_35089:417-1022(+)